MPLSNFMTATATTKRHPAISGGKRGAPVTHLESVKITPPMMPSAQGQHQIRSAIGLEGTAVKFFECYTESHEHTDDSVTVTQVPDVIEGDKLVTGGITYNVRMAEQQPATTSFGATLLLYITEDERA